MFVRVVVGVLQMHDDDDDDEWAKTWEA